MVDGDCSVMYIIRKLLSVNSQFSFLLSLWIIINPESLIHFTLSWLNNYRSVPRFVLAVVQHVSYPSFGIHDWIWNECFSGNVCLVNWSSISTLSFYTPAMCIYPIYTIYSSALKLHVILCVFMLWFITGLIHYSVTLIKCAKQKKCCRHNHNKNRISPLW